MTKQFSIAARDQGAGIPEQGLDRMAARGGLPFITAEDAGAEDNLRDFLLGRSVAISIDGAQHAAMSRPLLSGQARIERGDAIMERSEQPADRFKPVKPFEAKRNNCGDGPARTIAYELKALAVPEIVQEIICVVGAYGEGAVKTRSLVGIGRQDFWRISQDDSACIVLRQPEHIAVRWCIQRVNWEIVAPTSAEPFRSACVRRHFDGRRPCNPRHRHRCGEAIPSRYRMR